MTTLQNASLLIAGKASLILAIATLLFVIAGRRRPHACTLWQRFGLAALLVLPVAACALPTVDIPLLSPAASVKPNDAASPVGLETGMLPDPGGVIAPTGAGSAQPVAGAPSVAQAATSAPTSSKVLPSSPAGEGSGKGGQASIGPALLVSCFAVAWGL